MGAGFPSCKRGGESSVELFVRQDNVWVARGVGGEKMPI